ncbi:small ribosomal subunit protein uS15m [Engraulis encrasicolus]|uniref:small ribosomal subunit protein uS15m n=1 Tax=Engraulis encrasicolus TaxID=184585 RepID=UPI002FCF43D3
MSLRTVFSSSSHVWRKLNAVNSLKAVASVGSQHVPSTSVASRSLGHWCRLDPCITKGNENTNVVQPVRQYARGTRKKQEIPSQLSDLPPSTLKLDYAAVPLAQTTDDVVKRLLSLELASNSEKLRVKTEELIAKVQRDKNDRTSTEVKVAMLTARIRNFQDHLLKHPKDKANKRRMLMGIDKRKKKLKFLRRTRFEAFEHVCKELGITYTFPPEYYRRATKRWQAKKALCIKVFKELQKQRAAKRAEAKLAETPTSTSSSSSTAPQAAAAQAS